MNQETSPQIKKCPFCAEEIQAEALKCKHCGEWISEQAIAATVAESTKQQFPNAQPIWKFGILCIFSFGLYELYWFYKNWKLMKERHHLDISPFWRTFFAPLFAYSLFKNIFSLSKEKGDTKKRYPLLLTLGYILILLFATGPNPFWILSVFSFIPLLYVLENLNFYWEHEQPHLKMRENLTGREIVLLAVGGALWIIVLVWLFTAQAG